MITLVGADLYSEEAIIVGFKIVYVKHATISITMVTWSHVNMQNKFLRLWFLVYVILFGVVFSACGSMFLYVQGWSLIMRVCGSVT